MTRGVMLIALILPLLAGEAAAQGRPPLQQPGEKMPDVARRHQDHFARVGTKRGTGYKQYMRWQEEAAPRAYPSGELRNVAALTWLNHYRAMRAPTAAASRAVAVAAGIGTGNWRLVGPKRTAQDQRGDQSDIGRINAVAFHPSNPSILYAGSPAAGLWRSQDDGASWHALTDDLPLMGVSDIAIDPQAPDTIYIMTGDGESRDTPSIGIWKSVDGGTRWQPTAAAWGSNRLEYGYRLAIHPATPAILLAATTAGLLRTADGGAHWSIALAPVDQWTPFFDVLLHPADPSIVYAASRNAVYRSSDTGQTWTRLAGGLPADPDSERIRLAVTPANPNTLYVLYGAQTGFNIGLYRSDDAGATFVQRSSSNPPSASPSNPFPIDLTKPNILGWDRNDFGSQASYDLAMAVSPTNVDRVHVGGIDTWRSDDGGRTWNMTSQWDGKLGASRYTHADIHVLTYRGAVLYAGTDGGVYRSTDGGDSWKPLTAGLVIAQIYALCATPQDPDLLYYGAQDNGSYRLSLSGEATKVNGGDGFVCAIHPHDSMIVYTSVYNGMIDRSDDGGNSFRKLPAPDTGRGAWLTPFVLGVADPDHIYACYTDLWHSPDRGFVWKNLTNGALGASRECKQVAIAPSDPSTIYVVKSGSRDANRDVLERTPFLGGGGVFRTTDGGATWQSVTGNLPIAKAALSHVAVSPIDPRRVWVTFSGYDADTKVFGSSDGGATWSNLSAGLQNLPVNAIAAQKGAANGIYIGMDVGMFYRDERLGQWTPFSDGMPSAIVKWLVIDEDRQRIFAATYSRGIWLSELATAPAATAARAARAPYAGPLDIFE